MFTDELTMRWVTPIATRTLNDSEDFNLSLEKEISDLKQIDSGVNLSNFMGWHSTVNLFSKPSQALDGLKELLVQFVSDYISELNQENCQVLVELVAWANVLEKGGYHLPHTHSGHLSGVYYVNTGEPDSHNPNSGLIVFSDPRSNVNGINSFYLDFGSSFKYEPKAGMILLFPAYLLHWVHPFTGAGRRIAISFNVKLIDPPCREISVTPVEAGIIQN
ncbi:MAG: TIGR02466 family protein [Nostoc sp.]|uniref:TIGR02466 family protein n=1 Tax=Nostoc sp. TaxID=1180 RepID=UPI002FFCAFD4